MNTSTPVRSRRRITLNVSSAMSQINRKLVTRLLSVFASAVTLAVGLLVPSRATFASQGDVTPVVLAGSAADIAPAPFAVGEDLIYRATFGGVRAGSARMQVAGIETIRGRRAYHLVFTIDGGIPMFGIHDRYESWVDVQTLSSLRHVQRVSQGPYKRHTTYEIFPDRLQYQKNQEPIEPSVANPLDDASFIYAVRAAGVNAGETRQHSRYFKPDRNPVIVTGIEMDTVTVGAGKFTTTVVKPAIKSAGLFGENSDSRIWFSTDADRYPVQVQTHIGKVPVTLKLESITRGVRPAERP